MHNAICRDFLLYLPSNAVNALPQKKTQYHRTTNRVRFEHLNFKRENKECHTVNSVGCMQTFYVITWSVTAVFDPSIHNHFKVSIAIHIVQ